jgi:hypothetical protein
LHLLAWVLRPRSLLPSLQQSSAMLAAHHGEARSFGSRSQECGSRVAFFV